MNRVVITGLGAVSPLGNDVQTTWEGIKAGKNGIAEIKNFDASDLAVRVAAELKDFKVENYLDKKTAKRIDPFAQYAMVAAKEALADSGFEITEDNAFEVGTIIGTGIGGLTTIETEHMKAATKGYDRISPFFIPMSIANLGSGNVSIMTGAKGMCTTSVTACAAGANSIGDAFRSIKHGYHKVMISGGAEASVNKFGVSGFIALKALNESNNPERASIPFDIERSGFVMGEGAGVLILEELEHAKARGAKIYAEIVGYGATSDAYHVTAPADGGEGAARCMALALKEAGLTTADVDYINAHGTSTPLNDVNETKAIKTVFGADTKVPVSSTKSMTGHLLGASGALESIICIKSINDNFIPPTINYLKPDPECDLDYVPIKGRKEEVEVAITNSLGFGGHNATLVFKEYVE